jgi:hypothetical protein
MDTLLDRVRTRLVPALLTATGVTLIAAGLLTYTGPVAAGPQPSESPTAIAIEPTPAPTASASPSGVGPSLAPRGTPSPSAGAGSPGASPPLVVEPSATRTATRVRVRALKIDLPVIKPPGGPSAYPLCDVAMYIQDPLGQPGSGRATYLYAHARTGMFLPILDTSKVENGKRMLGMIIEVYTNDDLRFTYELSEVRRHQTTLDDAVNARTEQVWLQTSEGPRGTLGKTQVVGRFLSAERVSRDEARPAPHPVECG